MRSPRVFASIALVCALAPSAFAREPVRARRAMVVAQEPNATDAGVAILKAGGNAIDAAVATAFALAVTHPSAGNVGGGGFLLVRFASGDSNFIDFREMAPASASRNMYIGPDGKPTRDSVVGWRAAGVPGTVRGLALAHRKYGKLPWARLLQPAIGLAANGVVLSYAEARSMCGARKLLGEFPESKRIFLNGGPCFEPGDTLRQPELAQVLSRIAANPEDFYTGSTARILAEEMKKHGGEITLADLAAYKPVERRPLTGAYKGHDILTAPPPSSGGIGILQMLGMLEGSGYEKAGAGSAASSHYLAEVMRRYFADRSEFLGDSDFVKVPTRGLLYPPYISSRRASIDPLKATPSSTLGAGAPPAAESTHTTHLNVVDEGGNAVALTYTINNSYGNGVTVPRQASSSITRWTTSPPSPAAPICSASSRARPMPSPPASAPSPP